MALKQAHSLAREGRRQFELATLGRRPRNGKQLALVYGNCQAEALRLLLLESEEFTGRYEIARVPAVHLITARSLPAVRRAVSRAALLISHPVRDGYHGLEIGSSEIAERLPDRARRMLIANVYYEGHFPFQVPIHLDADVGAQAPLTADYHDLRFIHCSARRLSDAEASEWLAAYVPPADALRVIADASIAELRARSARVDVNATDAIERLLLAPSARR